MLELNGLEPAAVRAFLAFSFRPELNFDKCLIDLNINDAYLTITINNRFSEPPEFDRQVFASYFAVLVKGMFINRQGIKSWHIMEFNFTQAYVWDDNAKNFDDDAPRQSLTAVIRAEF